MPLKMSATQEAFKYNVRMLIEEGKTREQALAIAYSIQRKAEKRKRKK